MFDLKEMMRHASVTTTEQFYLGQQAEQMADELWRVAGHSFGHSQASAASVDPSTICENPQ
jgi:hypothetical protein